MGDRAYLEINTPPVVGKEIRVDVSSSAWCSYHPLLHTDEREGGIII
jgi:hypothetical protein